MTPELERFSFRGGTSAAGGASREVAGQLVEPGEESLNAGGGKDRFQHRSAFRLSGSKPAEYAGSGSGLAHRRSAHRSAELTISSSFEVERSSKLSLPCCARRLRVTVAPPFGPCSG